jgi:hypothetical protein
MGQMGLILENMITVFAGNSVWMWQNSTCVVFLSTIFEMEGSGPQVDIQRPNTQKFYSLFSCEQIIICYKY